MTDYTINPERGEVAVVFEGKPYPMRPSGDAQIAVEQITGVSIDELWMRCRRLAAAAGGGDTVGRAGLLLTEMAAVITECVKAAGKERNDKDLTAFKSSRVAELIAQNRFEMNLPVYQILTNMLFGGADPKKAQTESPATSQSDPAAS